MSKPSVGRIAPGTTAKRRVERHTTNPIPPVMEDKASVRGALLLLVAGPTLRCVRPFGFNGEKQNLDNPRFLAFIRLY